jgi:hypothetical protein
VPDDEKPAKCICPRTMRRPPSAPAKVIIYKYQMRRIQTRSLRRLQTRSLRKEREKDISYPFFKDLLLINPLPLPARRSKMNEYSKNGYIQFTS